MGYKKCTISQLLDNTVDGTPIEVSGLIKSLLTDDLALSFTALLQDGNSAILISAHPGTEPAGRYAVALARDLLNRAYDNELQVSVAGRYYRKQGIEIHYTSSEGVMVTVFDPENLTSWCIERQI